MGIKKLNPTTPSQRGLVRPDFSEITKSTPEKNLLQPLRKRAGRNRQGKVTTRHRGGWHKQMYRIIDFKRRDKEGVAAKVVAIEYDPNRSARLALVEYEGGEKRYIIWPEGVKVGDAIATGPTADIKPGNAMPLRNMPLGSMVHCIELQPGRGAQIVRTAGGVAQVMAKEEKYIQLRLPSNEIRRVLADCYATLGQVGNSDHQNMTLGKAGRKRWLGKRPEVRGKVMSPRDHPHGGGEGRNPIGMPGPKTKWGKPARGHKTRHNKKSNVFIVKRRKIGYGQVG